VPFVIRVFEGFQKKSEEFQALGHDYGNNQITAAAIWKLHHLNCVLSGFEKRNYGYPVYERLSSLTVSFSENNFIVSNNGRCRGRKSSFKRRQDERR